MYPGTDDRGVSEVVGFILVFGMLAISFTVYQGIVVPDQNRQVEFQHNQEVQGDLQDLRNAIVRTAATGSGEGVSVTLGATYPDRTIAQNLGVSAGAVETSRVGDGRVVLGNARAVGESETADYLDGSNKSFSTTSVTYSPVYTFYDGAPRTIYDNTVLYNRFDSANLTVTDQSMIDGRQITLVTLNGTLSMAQRDTVSLSTKPISASSNRVSVEGDGSNDVSVTIPTTMSAAGWREVVAEEYDPDGTDPDAYVRSIDDTGPRQVTFVFEGGKTYDLRMAKIGVGHDTDDADAMYLTTVSGNESTVVAGGTTRLVLEVRDAYDNPVSGATVNASGGSPNLSEPAVRTGADGRASFLYTVPSTASTGQNTVTFNISRSPEVYENATFALNVMKVSSSGNGGGGGNGGSTQASAVQNNSDATAFWGGSGVQFSIDNTGSEEITITAIDVDATGSARQLSESNGEHGQGQYETYISASGEGWYEAGDSGESYSLGNTVSLTRPASIDADGIGTFYLYQFQNAGGQSRDMAGQTVTVTLTFSDGSSTDVIAEP